MEGVVVISSCRGQGQANLSGVLILDLDADIRMEGEVGREVLEVLCSERTSQSHLPPPPFPLSFSSNLPLFLFLSLSPSTSLEVSFPPTLSFIPSSSLPSPPPPSLTGVGQFIADVGLQE